MAVGSDCNHHGFKMNLHAVRSKLVNCNKQIELLEMMLAKER